jgi:DNA (cytosine-5)-methyltransferase 1
VLDAIPELKVMPEGAAIVTHTINCPQLQYPGCSKELKKKILDVTKETSKAPLLTNKKLKFIDLFAGIGGFRQSFEELGCSCVFSSEWDEKAKETYFANYGEVPFGDIRTIDASSIPDFDILCAGFPCQPFSIAGVSKKRSLGRATGFEDKTQGTLFFDVCRLIKEKQPKAFFLENVKNLKSHDHGNTWEIIYETLTQDLGYKVYFKIVDGKNWVPQHRERIFIVGFNPDLIDDDEGFEIPLHPSTDYEYKNLSEILEPHVPEKYTLGPGTWACLQRRKIEQRAKGNGFGYTLLPEVLTPKTITSTISARYYKDGAEILIPQGEGNRPRRLTVKEAMQLQGLDPNTFVFPVGDNKAYKQIGNSVVIPAIKETGKAIISFLKEHTK